MKKVKLIFAIFPLLMASCFELDNYDAPNAGIDGALIDVETGDTVYTEQPDGCRIELLDRSYENPTPLQFWVKADGTFRNVALFSGDYDVTPTEGPFFPIDSELVHLKGVTKHDFKVTPYLRVNIEDIVYGEPGSAEVTVKYTIKRATVPDGMSIGKKTIAEARLLCNVYPVVSCYNGCFVDGNSTTKILSRSTDASIESKVYEDEVKNLESGETYYIRVAALSSCDYNSTLKRYNYTPVIEIVAP